ncbi:hypothetical protein ACFUEJ_21040 [Gordonia sp. NPDC057258]|uniref:hypothetical protein n=1 Tax=Gordonia sp. NPDC057258 TaxID=3346072 RepID=UPI0036336E4E
MTPDDWVDKTVTDSGRHHLAVGARARSMNSVVVVAAEGEHQLFTELLLMNGCHRMPVDDRFAGCSAAKSGHDVGDRGGDLRGDQRRDRVRRLVTGESEVPEALSDERVPRSLHD